MIELKFSQLPKINKVTFETLVFLFSVLFFTEAIKLNAVSHECLLINHPVLDSYFEIKREMLRLRENHSRNGGV